MTRRARNLDGTGKGQFLPFLVPATHELRIPDMRKPLMSGA